MRALPAEIETLLKSKSMVGSDRPNYNIKISGAPMEGRFVDPTDWTTWVNFVDSGKVYGNMCETSDGRAVITYVEGTDVKMAYATSVMGVLDGTATFNTAGATTLVSGLSNAQTSLNLIDGKLCMVLCYTDDDNRYGEFWQDPDGTGSGMAKVSDISTSLSEFAAPGRGGKCSTIHKLGNGNYVVLLPYNFNAPTFHDNRGTRKAFYSANQGVSWTAGVYVWVGLGDGTMSSHSKSFLIIGDDEFISASYFSGGNTRISRWTSSGAVTTPHDWAGSFYQDSFLSMPDGTHFRTGPSESSLVNVYQFTGETLTYDAILTVDDWELKATLVCGSAGSGEAYKENHLLATSGAVILQHVESDNISGAGSLLEDDPVEVISINVSHNANMASQSKVALANANGIYSPDNTGAWANVIWLNKATEIELGYGSNLSKVFTGPIDYVDMNTFPQILQYSSRDNLKWALDQTITDGLGSHVIKFENETPEAMFATLAGYAGYSSVVTEVTGLTIAEKTFSWESYGDAFSWLAEICHFEWRCDEDGILRFYWATDRQPEAEDTIVLSGTTAEELSEFPVVTASIEVWSGAGKTGTEYEKDTDYTIVEGTSTTAWTIARIAGGSIPDGGTVYVPFVYAAYVFREGEGEIINLGYTIDDNELYYQVVVHGKATDGTIIEATADYIARDYYNVLPQKILKIDASDATTLAQCQAIAYRAEKIIRTRARKVSFAAIGVPWLQKGDCIQIIESSTTISEIYRIIDVSFKFDKSGFIMQITAYHYGYTTM